MIGSTLELYSYIKAPKLTFAVKHPGKALKLAKARWDMKHAYAPRIAAAGAALVALPAGYVAGRLRSGTSTLGSGLAAALMAVPIGYLIGRAAAAEKAAESRSARWREGGERRPRNGPASRGRGREISEPRGSRAAAHRESTGERVPTQATAPLTGPSAAAPARPTRAGAP